MTRLHPVRLLCVGVLFPALLGGCSGTRAPVYKPIPTLESDRQLVQKWAETYPGAFKLIQRIVLVVGKKQYDFIGYLMMQRPDTFRALGMGELGGRIFDFEASGEHSRILRKPEATPPKPIEEGVVGDILFLFGGPPPGSWRAVRDKSERRVILWQLEDERSIECLIDAEQMRPAEIRERRNGRLTRRATFKDWKAVNGWIRPIPSRITIENLRWGYKMEIEQLQCEAVQIPPAGQNPPSQPSP